MEEQQEEEAILEYLALMVIIEVAAAGVQVEMVLMGIITLVEMVEMAMSQI
jgi:hypothetical protein